MLIVLVGELEPAKLVLCYLILNNNNVGGILSSGVCSVGSDIGSGIVSGIYISGIYISGNFPP